MPVLAWYYILLGLGITNQKWIQKNIKYNKKRDVMKVNSKLNNVKEISTI